MKHRTWKGLILAIASIAGCAVGDIVWPADSDWTALMQGTNFYWDAIGDASPGAADLVGIPDSYTAGSWAFVEDGYAGDGTTEDAFMFRLRLGSSGEGRNLVWQISLDTDGDASNVEWILQLVQTGKPASQGVELVQTVAGGPSLGDVDVGKNSPAWLGDAALFSRWTGIPGSSDYHVDIAMPWDTFTSITRVTELEDLSAVLSTSSSRKNIKGDAPLGAGLTSSISDVLSDSIPEPTVVSLLLCSGIGFLVSRRLFTRRSTSSEAA